MNDQISISRELLERIVGKCKLSVLGDDHARVWELLAAPAVDVEGLEVVAWQDAENQLYTTGEKRQMHGWATDGYPIVELVRLSDATAVIDQLRAELQSERDTESLTVAELRERVAELELELSSRLMDAEELAAIMEQSTVRAERILRLEDELAKLREGQEPVAWVDRDGSGHDVYWYQADIDRLPDGTELYASPVTKAVVIPNRMTDGAADYAYARYSAGWNACLDEFARLNRSKT